MTRTDQPSAEQASATPVRPPSRRELRKQWLAESGESDKKPTSIFDLPFVPRRRFAPPVEPPAQIIDPAEAIDAAQTGEIAETVGAVTPGAAALDLDTEPEESPADVPKPIRAKQASKAVQADALPRLLPQAERPDPTAVLAASESPSKPKLESSWKPKRALAPADTEKTAPAKSAAPMPPKASASIPPASAAAKQIQPAVLVQPSSAPATGTLLFERIPETEPQGSTDTEIVASPQRDDRDSQAEDDATSLSPRPRRRVAATLGAVAAFGLMVTMALPAFGPRSEVPAAAEEGQVLAAQGSNVPVIDIESFESLDELEAAAESATLEAGSFVNNPDAPVQYPFSVGVPLTDGFGPRAFPVAGFHDAQDFAAGYGAAVRAIASGKVLESGPTSDGCGFGLKLAHRIDGQNVTSRYCHLATTPVVGVGQNVRVGQFVALVGNSGMSYGPHLHLVIEVEGEAVDPMPYLAKYNKPRNQW